MFGVTFLGHQGWLLRSSQTSWLVDPLLREDFGHAHALGYSVHPPRALDLDAFPEIGAVFLTHEHDDHFDIPSLARLDRRIPIFLSARSSCAARQILEKMGFLVEPLTPSVLVEQGDLELVAFVGDHVASNLSDEWDTLPISVRHKDGAGSFFSMVDIALTKAHVQWARAHVAAPGIVTWSNNTINLSHMHAQGASGRDDTPRSLQAMRADHAMILEGWGKPAATLVCASGFAFTGERAWLNEQLFSVDADRMCAEMSRLHDGDRFVAARPGQTLWMEKGAVFRTEETTPFLSTKPRDVWPPRGSADRGPAPDYAPATGRRAFSDEDGRELQGALSELAATLVGGVTFRSLHSLLPVEARGRRLTFAFALRQGDAGRRIVFEYEPSSCSFRPGGSQDPERVYLAGVSCWASDLLAVLRGELGPIGILFGRASLWNALPRRFRFDIFEDLYRTSHPLRRPAAFLRTYERIWDGARADSAVIQARMVQPAPKRR